MFLAGFGLITADARSEIIGPLLPYERASTPVTLLVADLPAGATDGAITDLCSADFDGDGTSDLAVAWYVTYPATLIANNRRMLTIYRGGPDGLHHLQTFNLYQRDSIVDALSIFRNGTAAMGCGDFDGDGDADLAVTAFFGDEIWFIENRGGGAFSAFLRFPFGFNSPSNFLTPPEAAAADFDGDGREELVYVSDAIQHIQGRILHFWKTTTTISAIQRLNWDAPDQTQVMQWTRSLAVADFSGDGRPDICLSGTRTPPLETDPILAFWHGFQNTSGTFAIHYEFPTALVSDVIAAPGTGTCGPTLLMTDQTGASISCWRPVVPCAPGTVNYAWNANLPGYAGISPNRGMAAALGDLNADGRLDLVTRQQLGEVSDSGQVQVTMGIYTSVQWLPLSQQTLNSTGFRNNAANQLLRPRAILAADVWGSRLPEVIAGFALLPQTGTPPRSRLALGIWDAACLSDVTYNGRTDAVDVQAIMQRVGRCEGQTGYTAALDLDRDGCITEEDLRRVEGDLACTNANGPLGDMNCDGFISPADMNGFVQVLTNVESYRRTFPLCPPDLGDVNQDGELSVGDIPPFVEAFVGIGSN